LTFWNSFFLNLDIAYKVLLKPHFKHTNSKYHLVISPPPPSNHTLITRKETVAWNCLPFLHTASRLLPSCEGRSFNSTQINLHLVQVTTEKKVKHILDNKWGSTSTMLQLQDSYTRFTLCGWQQEKITIFKRPTQVQKTANTGWLTHLSNTDSKWTPLWPKMSINFPN
jgi:hypothetical protein